MKLTQEQRRLAEENQGLAWRVANHFHRRQDGEDARQELGAVALLALCEAAQGFDPDRGFAFSTYATRVCEQAIRDEKYSTGLICTPVYLSHKGNLHHRYRSYRDLVRNAEFSSIDFEDHVDPTADVVEQAEADELRDHVRRLPDRLRFAVERIVDGWTHMEISRSLGCTRQNVRHLIRSARVRFRKFANPPK